MGLVQVRTAVNRPFLIKGTTSSERAPMLA
jgi:hypothetical protein